MEEAALQKKNISLLLWILRTRLSGKIPVGSKFSLSIPESLLFRSGKPPRLSGP